MKATIKIEKEVELKTLRANIAVRYGDEDIPYDFPHRDGDMWNIDIDLETGIIQNWDTGVDSNVHLKVCDEGCYYLLDNEGNTVLSIEDDYVPSCLHPLENGYGDYVILSIDGVGKIQGWKFHAKHICEFSKEED